MTFIPSECACWIAPDIAAEDIVHASSARTYGSDAFDVMYIGAITTKLAVVFFWICVIASARPCGADSSTLRCQSNNVTPLAVSSNGRAGRARMVAASIGGVGHWEGKKEGSPVRGCVVRVRCSRALVVACVT